MLSSKKSPQIVFDQYQQLFDVNAKVIPAQLLNNAGIIGAAAYAAEQ